MTGEHALRAASCQIPVIWSWFALLLVIPGRLLILYIHQQVSKSGNLQCTLNVRLPIRHSREQ